MPTSTEMVCCPLTPRDYRFKKIRRDKRNAESLDRAQSLWRRRTELILKFGRGVLEPPEFAKLEQLDEDIMMAEGGDVRSASDLSSESGCG
eukprot:985527-Lingulodinium_polyedra.AAC.1